METNQILIPKSVVGTIFDRQYDVAGALEACQKGDLGKGPTEEYEAQFMPTIINTISVSPKDSRTWTRWWSSPSIRATGKTKQGNAVVVYAHVPNYFSNPDNIRKAIKKGLVNWAGKISQREFQRLVDLNELTDEQGNRLVWLVDYNVLKNSTWVDISIEEALEHPQTIPFCGGEGRARNYLEGYKKGYGEKIGVKYDDDLNDGPLARLLFVGNHCFKSIIGCCGESASFIGLKKSSGVTTPKIFPSLHQLERVISEYVAPHNIQSLRERLRALQK